MTTPPPTDDYVPMSDPRGGTPVAEAQRLKQLLAEHARRRIEGLKLYEPLDAQRAFLESRTRERLARGSNRSGKTLVAAVAVAQALTGQDSLRRYPREGGRAFFIGKNLDHCGEVMWRKLSRAGAFKMIRDAETGCWRAFRPWTEADAVRSREAKLAPPLIPHRLVASIAWDNKAKGIPKKVVLTNGWEINFYSSEGKPPQGSDVDLVWFDEEIVDRDWYPEMAARLFDRGGHFIWSATPQAGTDQLFELHERAEKEEFDRKPERTVEEFVILLADNKHFSDAQKREFASKFAPEDHAVRIEGEYSLLAHKVFPEYDSLTHGVQWFDIPANWTRYASVDPGRQICAVLFAAVPPPDEGDFLYFYDELYIPNCDSEQFGQRMREKCNSQTFQAFLIDHHGGRIREMGSGRSVEMQYAEALKRHQVACVSTGHQFTWGSDDVDGGVEAFRLWLRVRPDAGPKLRVLRDRCPNFDWEIRRYRYKRDTSGALTDKPEDRGRVHQMANCRYLSLFRPRWIKAPEIKGAGESARQALKLRQDRRKRRDGEENYIRLGPGRKYQ